MQIEGGILYFNGHNSYFEDKTDVRGKGNQHDSAKGVDLKINDEFIKNGVDNFFPFDIEETVKRSMLQKRAFRTITNIVAGPFIFQNKDGSATTPERQQFLNDLYKSIGISQKLFTIPVARSNYLQGGAFVALQWASNGREFVLDNVTMRQYKTGRLSFPIWDKINHVYPKHFFHRNWGYKYNKKGRSKKVQISKRTLSWQEWNQDPAANWDEACYILSYNEGLDLRQNINRLQSYLIADMDGLSEHYPTPVWYSGTTYNYTQSEFFVSCFNVDDIQNGFHASGIAKVYHKSYINPESGEAKETFEKHRKLVHNQLQHSFNSGAVMVVPVGLSGNGEMMPANDSIQFEPFKTNNTGDRHKELINQITRTILGGNGIIMPELIGVRDEKSTLSESGEKLINAVKLLLQFTVKPEKEKIENFLNDIVNKQLGIEERVFVVPNMQAFLKISESLAKHFLHPDTWYDLMRDFGLTKPTIEQIESGLIPAYRAAGNSMSRITIE